MHPDEDSQTTLSKWPFILGDVLLVATALAIAILGDWQLTNWQVAACVISVALGAALFVLPYVVEFQVRVREEREDRGAELRILHKNVVNGREEVEAAIERIETVEAAVRNLAQSEPDLSGPIEALEKKIDPVANQQSELAKQISALSKQVDALSAQIGEKPDAKSVKAMEADLAALKKEFAALPAKMPPTPAPEKAKASIEKKSEPAKSVKNPIDRPTRSPRERRKPEPRLIKRAIEQKQDKSSTAVSRIIESKSKETAPDEEIVKAEPETTEPTKPEKKETPKEEAKPSEVKKEPVAAEPEPVKEEPEPAEIVMSEPELSKQPEPEPEVKEKPKPAPEKIEAPKPAPKKEAPKSEPKAEAVAPAKPEEDMFGESVPAQVKKRVRTKKSDTAVIASVFIGIGNKPFVRGSGAGLSWDSGVEMEFEEIGKWRWIAPADLDDPIEIQLYRNDEDADRTGKYTLEPGQQLDLSPVF